MSRHRTYVLIHSRRMTMPLIPEVVDTPPIVRRRRWRGRPRPSALVEGEWPQMIGRLLALRGVTSEAAASRFFAPAEQPPDPYLLPNLSVAIDRLLLAVTQHERVAVFGDFDVDGVTSVAQLSEALTALGATPMPYVPDRFT